MRSWRRSSSATQQVVSPPRILDAHIDDADHSLVHVVFDQPVTWSGFPTSDFLVELDTGTWTLQEAVDELIWQGPEDFAPGQAWHWDAPDPTLTPTPDSSQTGTLT